MPFRVAEDHRIPDVLHAGYRWNKGLPEPRGRAAKDWRAGTTTAFSVDSIHSCLRNRSRPHGACDGPAGLDTFHWLGIWLRCEPQATPCWFTRQPGVKFAHVTQVRWLTDQEQLAWRSLVAMNESLGEYIERQLRSRCGLSSADFQVLAHLSEAADGRLRSFELTQLLRWEKGRLSQHLSRMQTRGLVSRERCLDDRRGAVVAITLRGRGLIKAAAPQHVADVRSVLIDHLNITELATLTAVANKVRERLVMLEPKV